MSGKTKNILIGVLIVGLVSMTVVYAALSQTLNINGSAQLQNKSSSWNVHFTDIESGTKVVPHGYASSASTTLSYDTATTKVTLPKVTFNAPGDSIDYYFDVINDGDITAKLQTVGTFTIPTGTFSGTDNSGKTAAEYTAYITGTLKDASGNALAAGTNGLTVTKGNRIHLKLTLTFSSEASVLPTTTFTVNNISTYLIFNQA